MYAALNSTREFVYFKFDSDSVDFGCDYSDSNLGLCINPFTKGDTLLLIILDNFNNTQYLELPIIADGVYPALP
jgi:hypothetical protein